MPRRYFRQHAPGHLVHIISRCVNGEFRLPGREERLEYLDRLERAQRRTDWHVVAYALMSNHVHLVAIAGEAPSAALMHPLHAGFARALNRRQGRFGPVFASRHATHVVAPMLAARLIAYVHNNPVRAGLVASAIEADETWTSHRAYLGEAVAPPWLAVERGFACLGLTVSREGQAAFAAVVAAHANEPRDAWIEELAEVRRQTRTAAGAPVEVSWPWRRASAVAAEVDVYATAMASRPRWSGAVEEVVLAVAAYTLIPAVALLSRSKRADIVGARRIALLAWSRVLGRHQVEMAGALGISEQAASRHLLIAESDGQIWSEARTVAEIVCHDNLGEKDE